MQGFVKALSGAIYTVLFFIILESSLLQRKFRFLFGKSLRPDSLLEEFWRL